ncbi:MAG TPA: FAD-binding protein [Pseudonocardiaceae bacterium]|jgi:aspartate oxidase
MADDVAAPTRAAVVVIGAGIAGSWLAYRLAQRGVRTVLISDDDRSRPLSRQAAGMIDRRVIECTVDSAPEVFADGSTTQDPAYPALMVAHARDEFAELARLVEYTRLDGVVVPAPGVRLGAGGDVVDRVAARFAEFGGVQLRGRVTDLVMDGDRCLGVRYDRDGAPGAIRCADVVFASGGFCGLLADGVGTQTGRLLGTYARHGGQLVNLELCNRFALGDLDRRRPLYAFDLPGARLLRAGEPAVDLMYAVDALAGETCDLDVFTHYWIRNLGVPHTVELADGPARLGPIRGFAVGGMATALGPRNVHAVGECAAGLSVDALSGKPFLSFLVLAAELAKKIGADGVPAEDLDAGPAVRLPDAALVRTITGGLDYCQDNDFTLARVAAFVRWAKEERGRRRAADPADVESVDLLVLAEAYARSVAARPESRGFFYRPDFPNTDPRLDNRTTVSRYDADADEVQVSLAPVRPEVEV